MIFLHIDPALITVIWILLVLVGLAVFASSGTLAYVFVSWVRWLEQRKPPGWEEIPGLVLFLLWIGSSAFLFWLFLGTMFSSSAAVPWGIVVFAYISLFGFCLFLLLLLPSKQVSLVCLGGAVLFAVAVLLALLMTRPQTGLEFTVWALVYTAVMVLLGIFKKWSRRTIVVLALLCLLLGSAIAGFLSVETADW